MPPTTGSVMAVLATLFVATPARAETGTSTEVKKAAVGVKAGGAFPSLFSELDTTLEVEIEGGLLLLHGHLEVDLSLGYSRPPASHSASDPRLSGDSYAWDLQQDILVIGAVGRYRLRPVGARMNLYGAIGPRVYLLKTTVNGESSGQAYGENRQYDGELGVELAGGGELRVGARLMAVGELRLGLGALTGLITGDASSSALGLLVGCRMLF